jgi:hypothetical protein
MTFFSPLIQWLYQMELLYGSWVRVLVVRVFSSSGSTTTYSCVLLLEYSYSYTGASTTGSREYSVRLKIEICWTPLESIERNFLSRAGETAKGLKLFRPYTAKGLKLFRPIAVCGTRKLEFPITLGIFSDNNIELPNE